MSLYVVKQIIDELVDKGGWMLYNKYLGTLFTYKSQITFLKY